MSFAELRRRRQELVGHRVRVTGKAFFLSRCPPPNETGQQGECSLTGLLADPSRQDLVESDRDEALALAESGRLLTCGESRAKGGACPGWRQAAAYDLVVDVEHQVLGGRETTYVQLSVVSKDDA